MNIKKQCKPLGLTLIIIGIFIIIIQPFSITGAVIDLSTNNSRIWFFVGLGLMIIGAVLLGYDPLNKFRGTDSLRAHNKEAQYEMRQLYKEKYGNTPTKQQLRAFMRGPHERGDLSDLVKERKSKK